MQTKLYQLDTKNNVKVWIIDVAKHSDYSEIVVLTGRDGGKLVTNISKVNSGKNEGKANSTTHYTQALSEMNAKIELQLRKGYVRDLKDVKSSSVLGSGMLSPMLAQKYDMTGEQKGSKTLEQLKLVNKEIIVQPKLDGNRCMIKVENGNITLYTRKGDVMPVQLSHIVNDLKKMNLSSNFILDGELFSKEISFNTLNGLIKREKASPEEIEKRKLIKFHLYDVMSEKGYEYRSQFIQVFASKNILIVPFYEIVATKENIQKHLEQFLEDGHEGLMIRQLGIGYENKRTWQLMKVKVFEDSEFKLVGFEEDVRGGFVGAFVMEDKNGKRFNAGASGQSVEERTDMWKYPKQFIGEMATVEYFGFSEYGIPRFPKFKGIRE